MLFVSRKSRQAIVIGDPGSSPRQFRVTVLAIRGRQVKLGIEADRDISVRRAELPVPHRQIADPARS